MAKLAEEEILVLSEERDPPLPVQEWEYIVVFYTARARGRASSFRIAQDLGSMAQPEKSLRPRNRVGDRVLVVEDEWCRKIGRPHW